MASFGDWVAAITGIALVLATAGLMYYTYILGKFAKELNRIENQRDNREQFLRDRGQIWSPLHSMLDKILKQKDDWLTDSWLNEDSLFFLLKPNYISDLYAEPREDIEQLKALRDMAKKSYSELEYSISLNAETELEIVEFEDRTGEVSKFLTKEFAKTIARELFVPLLTDDVSQLEARLNTFEKDYNIKGHETKFYGLFRKVYGEARTLILEERNDFAKRRDAFFVKAESIDIRVKAVLKSEGGELPT